MASSPQLKNSRKQKSVDVSDSCSLESVCSTHPLKKETVHGVYILASLCWKYTYVGYTVNFARRLRQHNREIKGGAKSTAGRKWQMILQITGLPDKHHALSLEWHLKKYPVRKSDVKRFGHDTFPIDSPSVAVTRRLRRLMVVLDRRRDKFPTVELAF